METEKYYFRVGIFLAAVFGMFAYVLTVFMLDQDQQAKYTYAIYFKGSVSGLTEGAPVRLKGITVGSVRTIEFASESGDRIRVLAEILETAPVREDTIATISIEGITATAYIALENEEDVGEPVPLTKKPGQDYKVIPSKPSGLEQFFDSIPDVVTDIGKLSAQGSKFLSDENLQSFELMLIESRDLMAETKSTLREVKLLARTVREEPSLLIRGLEHKGYKIGGGVVKRKDTEAEPANDDAGADDDGGWFGNYRLNR